MLTNLFVVDGSNIDLTFRDKIFTFNETQMSHWHIPESKLFQLNSKLSVWENIQECEHSGQFIHNVTNTSLISVNFLIVVILIGSIIYCMCKRSTQKEQDI